MFVCFAAQLLAAGGNDVAAIDLDLAASGTTLAAESDHAHTKPKSVLTTLDHVARRAKDIGTCWAGHSRSLWDITPQFLADPTLALAESGSCRHGNPLTAG